MAAIRDSKIHLGVDPLGGAGVHYWGRIAEQYRLDLTVVSDVVDPTFGFMTMDWDGKIRMDPSSPYAMARLVELKDKFDVAFACDTDHDRHGIVTRSAGLLAPNSYLAVAIDYLFRNRPQWSEQAAIGKTVVSSRMIDLVAQRLQRKLIEVPVGFKWFAAGLADGSLGFGGEESAGAAFLRRDGSSWTTDKDGLTMALLAAEITAKTGSDPGALYEKMTQELGKPVSDRVEAPADAQQKKRLSALAPDAIKTQEIAGEPITEITATAPGNGAAIGGIRVSSKSGWFAARPSGTEEIYKIYAESFDGEAHLKRLLDEAQALVDKAIA
jgi:phosphoglucomutase